MPTWWPIPIAVVFFLSALFTDAVRALALRFGVVDAPSEPRKQHGRTVPLLGGVAIFAAFTLVTVTVLLLSDHFTQGEITTRHFIGFFLGGFVLMIGGVLDDRYRLPAKVMIWFAIAASLSAVFVGGIGVSKITNPFGDPFLVADTVSNVLTLVWLMCMIYTTKLLDGLDGLATGVSAIGALMITLLALSAAFYQPDVALLALIVFATLLGFLVWNLPPAAIFLGEFGSTFVGYLIGVLAVISGSKVATALLVVGIPALDVLFVLLRRWRAGHPLFTSSDRQHLHFLLKRIGFKDRQILAMYYLFAFGFGVTTVFFESWQKLIALGILFIIMLMTAVRLSSVTETYETTTHHSCPYGKCSCRDSSGVSCCNAKGNADVHVSECANQGACCQRPD